MLAVVDPWGDDRADLRAAVNTMPGLDTGDADRNEVMQSLVAYLKINERPEQVVTPDMLRMILEG